MASTPGDSYIFDQQWEKERARLAGLSATFDATTIRQLAATGVSSGWHCLEVGAGTGTIARWLATAVGPTGRVVATDRDTGFLRDLDGPPVEVVQHDVTSDPIEEHAFDLVHARALVEHLPDRAGVIARLTRALRPGGVMVLEDTVLDGHATKLWERITCPPAAAAAMSHVISAVASGFRAIGADPVFGVELPSALRTAGLLHVEAELTYRLVYGGSPEAAFYELSLRQLGTRLIDAGLLAPQDEQEVAAMVKDPGASWLSLGLVSATGHAP